jgi:sugar/nucleoside kinase (ribokinase family)
MSESIAAIGNAIVDILMNVSEDDFEELGIKKGSMELVDAGKQKELLETFSNSNPVLVSGGSIANSVIAFAALGGKASFTTCIGDDRYGLHYESEFEQLGIALTQPAIVGQTTGTCVILITPDAERSMQTSLGVSATLGEEHIQKTVIDESDWLVIEGYVLSTEPGQQAAKEAIRVAKESGTKIVSTFSAEFIVQHFGEPLKEVVEASDIVLANLEEAEAYTGKSGTDACIQALKEVCSHIVITDGPNGAHLYVDGKIYQVPAVVTTPKDVTGAGDMFAGAYLYGICHGHGPEESAKAANFLAHRVIQQIGARLQGDAKEFWNHGTAA